MQPAAQIKQFVMQQPLRTAAVINLAVSACMGGHAGVEATALWAVSASVGMGANAVNLHYGGGGQPLPEDAVRVSARDITGFAAGMANMASQVARPSYWQNVAVDMRAALKPTSLRVTFHAVTQPRHYGPVRTALTMTAIAGAGYLVDASNVLGLRDDPSLVQAALGFNIVAASTIGVLTGKPALATPIFAFNQGVLMYGAVESALQARFGEAALYGGAALLSLASNYLLGKATLPRPEDAV